MGNEVVDVIDDVDVVIDNPSGDGEPAVDDKKEPSWENKFKEADRKLRAKEKQSEEVMNKLTELEGKVDSQVIKQGDDDLKSRLLKAGYDDTIADEMVSMKRELNELKSRPAGNDTNEVTAKAARDIHLDNIRREDKTGMVKKYEDEINESLDRLPASAWVDKASIGGIVNMIKGMHVGEMLSDPGTKKASPTETGQSGNGVKKETVLSSELEKFANERNLDMSYPAVKEKVEKAYKSWKKAQDTRNKRE